MKLPNTILSRIAWLRWLGLTIIVAVGVLGTWSAFYSSPGLSAEEVGRNSSWLFTGLFLSICFGFVAALLLPMKRGRYIFATSIIYAIIGTWNIVANVNERHRISGTVNSVVDIVSGDSIFSDRNAQEYQPLLDYLAKLQAESQEDNDEIDSAIEHAYSVFDFSRFPSVGSCDSAAQAWDEFTRTVSNAKQNLQKRLNSMQTDVEALALPDDFKAGLLSGLHDSTEQGVRIRQGLLDNYDKLASHQLEGCEFLIEHDVRVIDKEFVVQPNEGLSHLYDLIDKVSGIEGAIQAQFDEYDAMKASALSNLGKYQ